MVHAVRNGHIKRITDEDIQSSVLEIMSSNVSTTFITCPADPQKTLGIKLPFLVMILKNLKKYFSFEVQVGALTGVSCYCSLAGPRTCAFHHTATSSKHCCWQPYTAMCRCLMIRMSGAGLEHRITRCEDKTIANPARSHLQAACHLTTLWHLHLSPSNLATVAHQATLPT